MTNLTASTSLLNKYPKQRPALPEEHQKIYKLHYKRNREGQTNATSLSMRLEKWLHNKVAEDIKYNELDIPTLEIGAGTLNQLEYEPHVETYDVIEPFHDLFANSPHKDRIRNYYDDIAEVEQTNRYTRITSVATFEHILDLPAVIAKACLHLDSGGTMRTSIPNEGSLMWKLGTMITGFEFKRMYGLDYGPLMRHEHVNTAKEITGLLKYFFKTNKQSHFGIGPEFSFYRFIESSDPELDKAKAYLKSIGK